jgi:hypothetical protein
LKAVRESRQRLEISQNPASGRYEAILRLLNTRDAKYTDAMMLESLIEAFAESGCNELRDRVYGLLGLANDAYPSTRGEEYADSLMENRKSLEYGMTRPSRPRKYTGAFKVDYSRSFYDIWIDVVTCVYSPAKNIKSRCSKEVSNRIPELIDRENSLWEEERRISIIRTAGIVQRAFNQVIEARGLSSNMPKECFTFLLSARLSG